MKRTDSSSKKPSSLTAEVAREVARETDADRARAIVTSLRTHEPSSEEVFDAFWQLDALPVNDVRDAFTSWLGPLPDPDSLDPATRRAHGFPPPPLRLRTLAIARDADILDLGSIAEAQLRIAGTTWDGADLAPEDRLDGEIEGSLAGTVERRVLADVSATDATPLFDVLLFAEDAGVVFAAGSKTVIALIAYRKVETRDRRLRVALEDALFTPAIVAPSESVAATSEKAIEANSAPAKAVETKVVPQKTIAVEKVAATKTAAKKAATTKTAVTKASVKKAATKKPATKTTVAKKISVKKTAPKKTVAKKTVAKKTVAKKTGAKKTGAKKPITTTKPAAKKQVTKKAAIKKTANHNDARTRR